MDIYSNSVIESPVFAKHVQITKIGSYSIKMFMICNMLKVSFIIPPASTKLKGGILVSPRPSVRPSVSLKRPFVNGLFISWGTTGWWFVIISCANIHVTIDCSTVLPLVLGVVTRQKPQINGSVALGAEESPWPCGTPSWYTPLSWMILSKQKNLHLFSSQYICVFL